jgi:hypothetical protein
MILPGKGHRHPDIYFIVALPYNQRIESLTDLGRDIPGKLISRRNTIPEPVHVILKEYRYPVSRPDYLVKGYFAGSRFIADTSWQNRPVKKKKLSKTIHTTSFFSKLQIIIRILKSNYLSAFLMGCMLS